MTDRGARAGWDAILFDLDGTLADTVALILKSYRHTMRTHLGDVPDEQRWLHTIGRPLHDQIRLFSRSEDEAEEMLATYVAYQRTIHDEMTRPFPAVGAVVRELRDRGTPMGIVTSKRSGIAERTLGCCGLLEYFEVRVCADHVTHGKPHPEAVERALDLLSVTRRDRVLFVGDSPYDLEAGRRAGVRTAAALWGPFPEQVLLDENPDYVVQDMGRLPELRP